MHPFHVSTLLASEGLQGGPPFPNTKKYHDELPPAQLLVDLSEKLFKKYIQGLHC